MDFFEHQEKARKNTGLLIFYFILAVIGIVAAVNAVAALALQGFVPELAILVSIGTLGAIFLASLFKSVQLAGGGAVVAQELGGRKLDASTTDFHEKRLLNVIEEMAIASGMPVPDVYVMDNEGGINAFAAGKTTSDAVIGVTRGCMTMLSRDELQGVMAHEFSHILNGDMRLNIRLMGLLFGILFLAIIGQALLRGASNGARYSRNRDSGNGALALILFAVGIIAIGYIGAFFAKLIKAAVSRQREFLADASAVQFTRNPDGIAGALEKIGGLAEGSRVNHPMAEDASHLFFGSAFGSGGLATHPPLADRIRRIVPSWDGSFEKTEMPSISSAREEERRRPETRRSSPPPLPGIPGLPGMGGRRERGVMNFSEAQAIESMSHVHPEQITLSRQMNESVPEAWRTAIDHPDGAQSFVFALLLAQDSMLRTTEVEQLERATDKVTVKETLEFFNGGIGNLASAEKLALVDLAIPALRRLTPSEYERFRELTTHLMQSDRQIELFEFALEKLIRRHLDVFFRREKPSRVRFRNFGQLGKPASVLISTLAGLGARGDDQAAAQAFEKGAAIANEKGQRYVNRLGIEDCGLKAVEEALDRFNQASPLMKRRLLHACGATVMADGEVTNEEAELIRAIADTIGAPIPPFVEGLS